MKYYGNIQLNQNQIQQASLESETDWPTSPVVGQIVFLNKVVYICIQISGGIPIWVPLTRELEMYVHNQSSAATTWTITHNLNTSFVLVQVFDGNNTVVIPDVITISDTSTITISFTVAQAGVAVILSGSLEGLQKPSYAYEYTQASPTATWVINHNLGYLPTVRVFSGSYEIEPQSIFFNSSNTVTITFATPVQGIAKLV